MLLCGNSTAATVSCMYQLTSAGSITTLDSTTSCFDENWHHIAFTFGTADGVGKLYIDGTLEDTQTDAGDTLLMNTKLINTGGDSAGGNRYFSGDVDDVAIYTTALTAQQVLRNYKAGKGRHRN